MMSLSATLIATALLLCALKANCITEIEAKTKLESTLAATEKLIQTLFDRWQVAEYPNFLKSVEMSETSWELLKVKFQHKILTAIQAAVPIDAKIDQKNQFVISFLGSSVTAGHDSLFNVTMSERTRDFMKPAFDAAGIHLEVSNGAMGNNPCLPYDVCVQTFAGPDADIIQWEQSYNCFPGNNEHRVNFEQFIRQTMKMKSKPIVIFTSSSTPNWDKKDCAANPKKPARTDDEKKYLDLYGGGKNAQLLATTPKDIIGEYGAVRDMFQKYRMSGIQLWSHGNYESYKCHGPYVAEWGCCSASWHPSLLGHELRAAHYSFFWLLAFKDAAATVLKHLEAKITLESQLTVADRHISHEHLHIQHAAVFPSNFSDDMSCLTMFKPIRDPKRDLSGFLIDNTAEGVPFTETIFEDLMDKGIVMKAKSSGYRDFKHTVYGNSASKPLSIKVSVKAAGTVFLCQPPGFWGKLPDGFGSFWAVDTKFYLTENVANLVWLRSLGDARISKATAEEKHVFPFNKDTAKVIKFTNKNPKDSQDICAQSDVHFPAGDHVLTIVPVSDVKILISTILLP